MIAEIEVGSAMYVSIAVTIELYCELL